MVKKKKKTTKKRITKKVKKRVKPRKHKKMSFLKRNKDKTPRETAKEITEEKRKPEHLGKHSPETLQQEIYSLNNTKRAFRDQKWHERAAKLQISIIEILTHEKHRPRGVYEGLHQKLHDVMFSRFNPFLNLFGYSFFSCFFLFFHHFF